ncbi:MAG: DASH family cryptochrome [Spirochaetota bacterium]
MFFHDEPGPEEALDAATVTQAAHERCIAVHRFFGASLYHPEDLPWAVSRIPDLYTTYRKQIEARSSVRAPFPAPRVRAPGSSHPPEAGDLPTWFVQLASSAEPCERTAFPFAGGERAAGERLQSYLWETDRIQYYKETRNGLLGTEYSSKLSPWLANGAISPRTVYAELRRYEETRIKNESTYWLFFELMWRDFYIFQMLKHGTRSFRLHGPFGKKRSWDEDALLLEAWKTGRTGVPFVDAGMRELSHSGYMSNRIRQNCASFFSNNLNLDWRFGAQWFESQLLDYDVSSNWGNWAYNSRVGCDMRDRFFDVVGQGVRYDPNGVFIASWVPELASLPGTHRHRPWEHRLEPAGYPQPVVNLEETYERLRRESRKS